MSNIANSIGEEQWDDITTQLFAIGTNLASPVLTLFTPVPGMRLYGFSGTNSTPDELFCTFEMPHGYKQGTDLRAHIHWTPNDNAIANVHWQLSISVGDPNIVFPSGILSTVTTATKGINIHQIDEFLPVVSGTLITIGSIICCRLFRNTTDPLDTYTGIAKLLSLGIHYQKDTLGSRQVFIK